MAHSVLVDGRFYLDGLDLSGDTSSVDLTMGTAVVTDGPVFGQTCEIGLAGTRKWSMGAAGLLTYGVGASEEGFLTRFNRSTSIVSAFPTGVDGDPGYFGQAFESEFAPGLQHNDAIKWKWGGGAAGLLVRGSIIHIKASRSSTGNGTAFQLGAVAAGKSLYAALHVFTATGTTLVVKLQSDDNGGMSSPTDRLTFNSVATTVGAQFSSVAGAITDDWWRIVYTITGAGPYVLAVGAGIV